VRSVRWTPEAAKLVFQHRRVKDGDIYLLTDEAEGQLLRLEPAGKLRE
jgi:hypothetical protein